MAKRKKSEFEYIRAHVDGDGGCEFLWKLKAAKVAGGQSHDEDVSGWTDDEIAALARQMASAEDDPIEVEVIHG